MEKSEIVWLNEQIQKLMLSNAKIAQIMLLICEEIRVVGAVEEEIFEKLLTPKSGENLGLMS